MEEFRIQVLKGQRQTALKKDSIGWECGQGESNSNWCVIPGMILHYWRQLCIVHHVRFIPFSVPDKVGMDSAHLSIFCPALNFSCHL
jgi:hypothetical protein